MRQLYYTTGINEYNHIKEYFLQIKPDTLNKDSLWAQIDESEIASDDIFDYLKKKFSTAR
jgi:hypothetical protein